MDICNDGRVDKCLNRSDTRSGKSKNGIAIVCCKKNHFLADADCQHHPDCRTHANLQDTETYCNSITPQGTWGVCSEEQLDTGVCCQGTVEANHGHHCGDFNRRRTWTASCCHEGGCNMGSEYCDRARKNKCIREKSNGDSCKCDFQCSVGGECSCITSPFESVADYCYCR